LVISCGDASPVLEARKGALDDIPALVGLLVEWVQALAGGILFDDRCRAALEQEGPKIITVVGGIAQQRARGRQWLDQCGCGTDIPALSWGQLKGDQPPVMVENGMD